MKVGDSVIVADPGINDLWNHSFEGSIVNIKDGCVSVEDMDGNVWDVDLNQIEKAP